jgi:uncharacterized membrane protein YdjX (TVP38/TMEM64 family)
MDQFLSSLHAILVDYPLLAPLVFVCVHTVMAAFFLPCSPMTLMSGALWGGMYGLVVSLVAAVVSCATTFYLSRSLFRVRIEKFILKRYPKVTRLLAQSAAHDWKFIAATQLNPLIPASTMGYVFGITRIPFSRYLLFSSLFMLPLQLLFVVTGKSLFDSIASKKLSWMALTLIIAAVIFPLVSKYIFKKYFQRFGINDET